MIELGTASYVLTSILYAILSFLLILGRQGSRQALLLIAACVSSTLWGISQAWSGVPVELPDAAQTLVDFSRVAAWAGLLATQITAGKWPVNIALFAWAGATLAALLAALQGYQLTSWLIPGIGVVGLAVAGLACLVVLYRRRTDELARAIKFLAAGVGGVLLVEALYYGQAQVGPDSMTTAWVLRSAGNILFLPLVAVAARQLPGWGSDIFISRQAVLFGAYAAAIATYSLLAGLAGYALLGSSGDWTSWVGMLFVMLTASGLAVLVGSRQLRARLKVFLSKHFFRNKYDYREEWLRLIATLGELESSSTRQIAIKALAQIVGSPSGLLWLLDDKEQNYLFSAQYGVSAEVPDIDSADPLIKFIKRDGWLIDLQEFRNNRKLYGNLQLADWLFNIPRAWLIVPLISRHQLVGLVMLTQAPGSAELNYEDRDLLKTVGNHVAVHLAQEQSDSLLAEAQQFDAYNRLTAFLMHDLNNLVAQQSLIVENAEKYRRNPEFVDDAIETIAGSVGRMKRVMRQLRRDVTERATKLTELRFIASSAIDNCAENQPTPILHLNGVNATLDVDAEQFTMVLTHLVRNAQDATPADGKVEVSLREANKRVLVEISDTGCGMTPDFVRDRLFRPFDSTRGAQGMGIGAYQAREFARRMGGELHVQSVLSEGTTVTLTLPIEPGERSGHPASGDSADS